jgi:hypothetical protein
MIVSTQHSFKARFLTGMSIQRQCRRFRTPQRRHAMVYNFRESSEVQDWRIKEMVDVRCFVNVLMASRPLYSLSTKGFCDTDVPYVLS